MAYREVTMIEITEVLRQWVAGARRKQIARRLGLEPKTVRRYLRPAARGGRKPSAGTVTPGRRPGVGDARPLRDRRAGRWAWRRGRSRSSTARRAGNSTSTRAG